MDGMRVEGGVSLLSDGRSYEWVCDSSRGSF